MGAASRAAGLLGVLLALLVVAGVVLGVVDARASARADDAAAAVAAVRTHLTALGAAGSSPVARARALEGATGSWRARLGSGAPPTAAGAAVAVRAVGLESLDGDAARVLATARVADGSVRRVEATLTRRDGRWLVGDLQEVR